MSSARRIPHAAALHGALIVVAVFAANAAALGAGYVWLDHAHIEQGLALAPPAEWPALFARSFAGTGFYRPLMALSLSVDAAVWKAPLLFRLVTLGWHGLAAFMTQKTGRVLGLSPRAALIAALLVAIHPTTTLVASVIAFRSEAMTAVFLLGLIGAHVRRNAWLSGVLLFAGALTKETAWLLGPMFVIALELSDWAFDRERSRPARALTRTAARKWAGTRQPRSLRVLFSEGCAFGAATALRFSYAPKWRASHAHLSFDQHIGSRLAALEKSAHALALPLDRTICDAIPITQTVSVSGLAGGLVLAGVALLVVHERKVGLLFALSLVPALGIVPLTRWWSPHYLYVPLCFGAMLAARELDRRVTNDLPLALAAGVLALISLSRSQRYTSDTQLWTPEVSAQPACREGHFFLGEVAREARDWQRAATHYERAAEPVPGYLSYADELAALQNLGAVELAQQRFAEARTAWTSALRRTNDSTEQRQILHNLAVLALRTGNAEEASRLLEPETRRKDALAESLLVRARALHELGRELEARALISRLPR